MARKKKEVVETLEVKQGARSRVLQQIYDEYGEVKPSVVVKVAADEDCEIHEGHGFEWDDAIAAHEHRLDVARRMIRSTKIVYEGRVQNMLHVPVVHISGTGRPGEGSYKPISSICKSQSEFERAFAELTAQAAGLNKTIELLQEAATTGGINKTVNSDLLKLSRAANKVETLINNMAMQ